MTEQIEKPLTVPRLKAKVPPNSVEAEQSVLGGVLLNNLAWDQVVEVLRETDFYRREHQLIFQVMTHLSAQESPMDVLTVSEELKQLGQLDKVGSEVYLFELANNTPSAANIQAYAEIVREKSILRQLIGIATDITDAAYQPQGREISQLLDDAEGQVFRIAEQSTRGQGPTSIKDLLSHTLEHIDKLAHSKNSITGQATGFKDLDRMTSGLHKADFVVIAGRPSMGKTACAMNIAEHVAIKDNKPTLIFSMEMPAESLAMRMISSLGRVDQHRVRTGRINDEDWSRICGTINMLSEANLYIDDTPALSPMEVRARTRRLAREKGEIGLIVIDYLQLMQVPGYRENRVMEISNISRSLKALAKELKVPVVALSQLNRGLEQRPNKRPMMSDLRESGAIEQDADLICFIYRDEVYNENSPEKGIAEVIVAKQRNGPIGTVRMAFLGKYTRFENLADKSYTAGPAE